MTILVIFCSTFAVVFLLGLQSLTVNGGHKAAAFINSCFIGIANITILKVVPNAQGVEIVVYILAGPLGIVSSMYFFAWYRSKKR